MSRTRDTGASPAKVYNRAQCTAYIQKHIDPSGEVRGEQTHDGAFRCSAWVGSRLVCATRDETAPKAWTRLMLLICERVLRKGGRHDDT